MPQRLNYEIQDAYLSLLREIRVEAKLTQVELSKRLGKPQSYVSKYERGERKLEPIEVLAICKVSKTSFVEFAEKLEKKAKAFKW